MDASIQSAADRERRSVVLIQVGVNNVVDECVANAFGVDLR